MCVSVIKTLCGGLTRKLKRARPDCGTDIGKNLQPLRVTIIEGQSTGPVMCEAVRKIFDAALVPVKWDPQKLTVHRDPETNRLTVNPEVLRSAVQTGLVLRAQDSIAGYSYTQWMGTLALNKALNAFIGVRKFVSVDGYEPYGPVNLTNIRENVSGEYSEIEHLVDAGVVQSIKTVSKKNCVAVAEVAFEYATKHGHSRITALHKANAMRLSDGMFLKACREVSACYPDVEYNEEKLDTFCLTVTTNPGRYDVLLTTSLYGAFTGAVCGAMSGGLVTVPSAAYGPKAAVFSTMTDYGYDNYGRGDLTVDQMLHGQEPIVNPTGLIRAAVLMLEHAGRVVAGHRIAAALENTIQKGIRTQDMGGNASCSQFTDAIIRNLKGQILNGGKECS